MPHNEGPRRASMPGAYSQGAGARHASIPGAVNRRSTPGVAPPPRPAPQAPAPQAPAPARQASTRSTATASVAGFALVMAAGGAVLWACRAEPPGPSTEGGRRASTYVPSGEATAATAKSGGAPVASATGSAASSASAPPGEPPPAWDAPWDGPSLGALSLNTPVYDKPDGKKRIGYLRHGGRVPVEGKPEKRENCKEGWHKLVEGGYVCGRHATLNASDPALKLGIVAPTVREVLPYKYAYNSSHGTPLYKSVPSRDDMLKYEPYLEAAKKKRAQEKQDDADAGAPSDAGTELAGAKSDPAPEEARPWWEQNDPGKLNLKLSDLEQDADGTVQKRMMKGFFVAVDKTFGWHDRLWYKTTAGLVAPADRMLIIKPPTTKGLEGGQGVKQVGFFLASKGTKFQFDDQKTNLKVAGTLPRHTAFGLTGATFTYKDVVYRQTTEGWWMKEKEGTWTEPGPPPKQLQPGEKWIDVNLTRKTLVAFEGDRMVYATVVSPGKRSKNKQKDHATVQGTFRIREKHLAVTMDGDGKAAGDLPYSIEDVPYVQYFEGSYALHGAFWHNDFGRERSHGCVNLSPLDAKWVFFWSEPRLPRGWHGVWATPEHKGTLVVVHE